MKARLELAFSDAEAARQAMAALAPDDPGSVVLRLEGATLVVEAAGPTAFGVLRTLDDVLGCLRATGIA